MEERRNCFERRRGVKTIDSCWLFVTSNLTKKDKDGAKIVYSV